MKIKNEMPDFAQKRQIEHEAGAFLVDFALKNFYKIKNPVIEVKNKKPILKNANLHFSISHTKNLVMAGFAKSPVGLDVEFIKDRDFKKLSVRYNKEFNKKSFYEFWTNYEAEIKLQAVKKTGLTFEFENDYMVTLVSFGEVLPVEFYEVGEDLCLKKLEF